MSVSSSDLQAEQDLSELFGNPFPPLDAPPGIASSNAHQNFVPLAHAPLVANSPTQSETLHSIASSVNFDDLQIDGGQVHDGVLVYEQGSVPALPAISENSQNAQAEAAHKRVGTPSFSSESDYAGSTNEDDRGGPSGYNPNSPSHELFGEYDDAESIATAGGLSTGHVSQARNSAPDEATHVSQMYPIGSEDYNLWRNWLNSSYNLDGYRDPERKPEAPLFHHGKIKASGWANFEEALGDKSIRPVRAMVLHVPTECFSTDAGRFTDWQTPIDNSFRAASIAAITGLFFAPLSKGYTSGNHEEKARALAAERSKKQSDESEGPEESGSKIKHVSWHMQMSSDGSNLPMTVCGYEDIFDDKRSTVLAVRIWHFVFDPDHSTSHLANQLMLENASEGDHSGAAHMQGRLRKATVVNAAKASRNLVGASLEGLQLELAAGNAYRHVTNESVLKNLLTHYAGKSDNSGGRPPIDLAKLPPGALNARFDERKEFGCVHAMALEHVFNAKRPEALCAGLVHLDGTLMNVHPDQLDVRSYFDGEGRFQLPDWVRGGAEAQEQNGSFFFQTDPHRRNVFDMSLPRPISGAIRPGENLLRLFVEAVKGENPRAATLPLDSAELLALFNNAMTGRDQFIMSEVNSMAASIVTFDTFDASADERNDANSAKAAAAHGLASYGQMEGDSHVVEPRQVLKEHAYATSNIHAKVIAPWAERNKHAFSNEESRIRRANGGFHAQTDIRNPVFADLVSRREQFEEQYEKATKELVLLHLAKMERSFNSKIEKETIPAGYKAVWNGLQKELKKMPNGTANLAFAQERQLTDSDRTVFGHWQNWVGNFFEEDMYVDGRDWRLMQELFLHCFEQFGEQTLLLLFCGPKGNGKTLRTERAMRAFVDGWIQMSGPSSAKAGMQGNSDSSNGCNCIYDEMIDELTDGDGSNRTEYWKMILLKRQYVYNKAVVVKGADGREQHKTFKLKTPHQETHCVCTNRGPAFTRGQEEPSEVKSALIDRAVVQFVRTLGSKTRSDDELETNLCRPEVQEKITFFRIITCLTALVKMLIFRQPYLKPDLSMAQRMFDYWDDRVDIEHGLPKPTPRKNIKRIENLVTLTVLNAVLTVFGYKQTAMQFESGQISAEFPDGKPFDMSMLWEVVSILAPTREIIHYAWVCGLEYSIGTSCMGLNTLTAIAESVRINVGDRLKQPCTADASSLTRDNTIGSHEHLQGVMGVKPIRMDEARSMCDKLSHRRRIRNTFRYKLSSSSLQHRRFDGDVAKLVHTVMSQEDDDFAEGEEDEDDAVMADAAGNSGDAPQNAARRRSEFPTILPFSSHPQHPEPQDAIAGVEKENYLDPILSALIPEFSEVSLFYRTQDLFDFCLSTKGVFPEEIPREDESFKSLCCLPRGNGWKYAKSKNGEDIDTAWVRLDNSDAGNGNAPKWGGSWHTLAHKLRQENNRTMRAFDFHLDGLRDCLYLLSTKDNDRRVAEMPRMQPGFAKNVFKPIDGGDMQADTSCITFNPQFYEHNEGWDWEAQKPKQALPRHPSSGVLDNEQQRRLDTGVLNSSYTSIVPFFSNRINISTPIRPCKDGFEVNLVALTDHVDLIAEAVYGLADLPGVKNLQEQLCNGQSGPDGLKVDMVSYRRMTVMEERARRERGEPSAAPAGQNGQKGQKRKLNRLEEDVHTLPYSYDIVQIWLARESMNDMYDDLGEARANSFARLTGACNIALQDIDMEAGEAVEPQSEEVLARGFGSVCFNGLPQFTTRFSGFDPDCRQLLSIKVGKQGDRPRKHVEVQTSHEDLRGTYDHVTRTLGRPAEYADLVAYAARKQGSRDLGGVSGDLWALTTWIAHTTSSLANRGLLRGEIHESSVRTLLDSEHMIEPRTLEWRCSEDDALDERFAIAPAEPRTYSAVWARDNVDDNQRRDGETAKKIRLDINQNRIDTLRPENLVANHGFDPLSEHVKASLEGVKRAGYNKNKGKRPV